MHKNLILVVVVFATLTTMIFAHEGHHNHNHDHSHDSSFVVDLDTKNFFEKTSSGDWFVEFYAPWCGHCKNLAPTWEELATKLHMDGSKVNIAKVDCVTNKLLAKKFSIKGFPTMVMLHSGKYYEYDGNAPRTVDALVEFTKSDFGAKTDGETMPKPFSSFDPFLDFCEDVIIDVIAMWEKRRFTTLLMAGIVFLFGVLVTRLILPIFVYSPLPPQVTATTAQTTKKNNPKSETTGTILSKMYKYSMGADSHTLKWGHMACINRPFPATSVNHKLHN